MWSHETKQLIAKHTHCIILAVHNRLDLSLCSDDPPKVDLQTLDVDTILSSQQNLDDLIRIIAGRIIHKYIPAFTKIPQLVKAHTKHIYSEQMSRKSTVVRYDELAQHLQPSCSYC